MRERKASARDRERQEGERGIGRRARESQRESQRERVRERIRERQRWTDGETNTNRQT